MHMQTRNQMFFVWPLQYYTLLVLDIHIVFVLSDLGVVFDVDRTSGKLRVIGILDHELRDNFTITVQVNWLHQYVRAFIFFH